MVNQCTGCIVSLPDQPKTSMRYEVSVTEGLNAILNHVGTVNGYYPSNTLGTENLSLAPGSSYTWTTEFASVCIGTTQPIQVTSALGAAINTFNVQSVYVTDQGFTSMTVTNPATATQTANVAIFYTVPDTPLVTPLPGSNLAIAIRLDWYAQLIASTYFPVTIGTTTIASPPANAQTWMTLPQTVTNGATSSLFNFAVWNKATNALDVVQPVSWSIDGVMPFAELLPAGSIPGVSVNGDSRQILVLTADASPHTINVTGTYSDNTTITGVLTFAN